MLEKTIRGEMASVQEYEKVLDIENLPMGIATLIRAQLLKIRTHLNRIKRIEGLQ